MVSSRLGAFLLGCSWLLALPAQAREYDDVIASGYVRIGLYRDFPPYSYLDRGEPAGGGGAGGGGGGGGGAVSGDDATAVQSLRGVGAGLLGCRLGADLALEFFDPAHGFLVGQTVERAGQAVHAGDGGTGAALGQCVGTGVELNGVNQVAVAGEYRVDRERVA